MPAPPGPEHLRLSGAKLLSKPNDNAPIEEGSGDAPERSGETQADACVQSHRPGFQGLGPCFVWQGWMTPKLGGSPIGSRDSTFVPTV